MGVRNVYTVKNGKVVPATPRKRLYVGYKHGGGMERFWNAETPTESSHGKVYAAVIGPFRTVAGAEFMVNHGAGNPHICCVADAERLARIDKSQHDLCQAELDRLKGEIRRQRS